MDCGVSHRSVLDMSSLWRTEKTLSTLDIAGKHQVQSHFYAYDSQMYDSCRPQDVSVVRDRLTVPVVRPTSCWCASRRSVRGGTWIDCMTRIGMSRSTRRLFPPSPGGGSRTYGMRVQISSGGARN